MKQELKNIASYASHWLENETRNDQNLWIVVNTREEGLDIAKEMFELRFGTLTSTNTTGSKIPYDSLPTYAANAYTNNKVFILLDETQDVDAYMSDISNISSSNNIGDMSDTSDYPVSNTPFGASATQKHSQYDTALVTMNESTKGDITTRQTSMSERQFIKSLAAGRVDEDFDPSSLSSFSADIQDPTKVSVKGPDILLINIPYPPWHRLTSYISPSTEVLLTGVVKKGPPKRSKKDASIDKLVKDLDKKLFSSSTNTDTSSDSNTNTADK